MNNIGNDYSAIGSFEERIPVTQSSVILQNKTDPILGKHAWAYAHPFIGSQLYPDYFYLLSKDTPEKGILNKYAKDVSVNIEQVAQISFLNSFYQSEYIKERLVNIFDWKLQKLIKGEAFPAKYQLMGLSPRITPIYVRNSLHWMRPEFREAIYSGLVPCLNGKFVLMDLDLKSCFMHILLGLSDKYNLDFFHVREALNTVGLWEYIRKADFESKGLNDWYHKPMVKHIVYSSLFGTRLENQIKEIVNRNLLAVGIRPYLFEKEYPLEYHTYYEKAQFMVAIFLNSEILYEIQRAYCIIQAVHVGTPGNKFQDDVPLRGPTGHQYRSFGEDHFRSVFPYFFQSFEFSLVAKATLMLIQKYPKIQLISDFHDGVLLLVPTKQRLLVEPEINAFLNEIREKLGLSYPIVMSVKNIFSRNKKSLTKTKNEKQK